LSGIYCSLKPLSQLLQQMKSTPYGSLRVFADPVQFAGLDISGVASDSRKVQPGNAFFCLEGEHTNGNKFAEDAIRNGAVCVFSEDKGLSCSQPLLPVTDVRLALALAANYIYDTPSLKIRLWGVTGTNGKTTTTHLVEQILNANGKSAGLIGTLGARWHDSTGNTHKEDCGQTTPQAPELQKTLFDMVKDDVSCVAMEVSSHALSLKRVVGCHFAGACLTNITQDHLDFHKSMEQYWHSKLMLFGLLSISSTPNRIAVVNLDEPLAYEFIRVLSKDIKVQTFSTKQSADLNLKGAEFDFHGSRLQLETPMGNLNLNLKLNGPFNVYNVMAALLICLSEGIDLSSARAALEEFSGVPGRFQIISSNFKSAVEEPLCIVDYAHTPDGLQNILKAARTLVPAKGSLVVVFGCGGDRDTSKRPQMGEIAEKLADRVLVTSDNPRSEDPQKIISEILTGITRLSSVYVESDRAKAISLAISTASPKDVIVVAGKGHEDYQILSDRTIPFDDRSCVKDALQNRHQEHNEAQP